MALGFFFARCPTHAWAEDVSFLGQDNICIFDRIYAIIPVYTKNRTQHPCSLSTYISILTFNVTIPTMTALPSSTARTTSLTRSRLSLRSKQTSAKGDNPIATTEGRTATSVFPCDISAD